MRKKVIAGNWKMNMLPNEAMKFIEDLAPLVKDTKNEVILCVPYTDLFYALLTVQGTNIKIGAQNMHFEEKGAYTGEISAKMLKPIVCVGETLEQRDEGTTIDIITNQTKLALEGLTDEQVANTIIAYEPIWAIGTGKTATSEDAQKAIKSIRDKICQIYGQNVSDRVIIQYGGSVKSSNAKELFEMSDIDGGLVGGASLKPDEFSKIVNYNK